MGSRVHYILIDGGRRTLYTRGGGSGYDFDIDFAVGPDVVSRWLEALGTDERFAQALPAGRAEGGPWLGSSCEGAILIDTDRRELLLYWDHVGTHYREAMLDGYARTWPGWRIEWAVDGLADLVARAGLEPSTEAHGPWNMDHFADYEPGDGDRFVVSRTDGGRTTVHGLSDDEPWWYGVWIFGHLPAARSAATWDGAPVGGMHFDEQSRTATVWSVRPINGLREEWADIWPGWHLDFRGADIDAHVALCQGAFAPPPIDLPKELARLARRIHEWPIESEVAERVDDLKYVRPLYWHYFAADLTLAERDRAVALILGTA